MKFTLISKFETPQDRGISVKPFIGFNDFPTG